MAVVADLLVDRGLHVGFIGFADRIETISEVIAPHRMIPCPPAAPPTELPGFRCLFVMNDWGVETQGLIRLARLREVPSIARVEGVQDFRDLDTNRATWPYLRLPYLAADHVLAQGSNDVDNLDRPNVHVVGNGRLESLFGMSERSPDLSGRAVINSNFTYGVLNEARGPFLRASVDSCTEAGLEPIISQHPADRELPARFRRFASDDPMSDLLLRSDVLISRFSTVPFEAMAVGTPFVYFNPHCERVPTFAEPQGAFESTADPSELPAALSIATGSLGGFRARAEQFFRRQIDISNTAAPERTANAIVSILNR